MITSHKILFLFFITFQFCQQSELDYNILANNDTDSDGYTDLQEQHAGSDPYDSLSIIYQGGWPYNVEKEQILGQELPFTCPNNIGCECNDDNECSNSNCTPMPSGGYCTPKVGDTFAHFYGVDQYGEMVDIYDFANQGKMILIEFGAVWCNPCNQLSAFFHNGNTQEIEKNVWWKDEYKQIKNKIDSGEIFFITVLYQDESRNSAGYETVKNWHEKYPNNNIAVLADQYKDLPLWMKSTGYPCINLLDENMKLLTDTQRGLAPAFNILSGLK